jgi:spore germination protein YaaH
MRSVRFVLAVACGVGVLVPALTFAAPVKSTLEVSGWLPYWRVASSTADTAKNLQYVTTVHPFGYFVQKDGTVANTARLNEEPWTEFLADARAKKVRIIPSIVWHDGTAIHAILSDPVKRAQLENDIVTIATVNNWDGIDLDFEGKLAETKDYFSLFLKELYTKMGKKWVYCTIEPRTPLVDRFENPPKTIEYANDYVEINKYCDRVQIMAYDQGNVDINLARAAAGPYVPVADIRWVEKVMREAMKTIAPKKLVIGIPTYGYEYAVTPLQGSFSYSRLWAFNQKYAVDAAAQLGQTPVRAASGEFQLLYIPSMLTANQAATSKEVTTSATSAQNLGVPATAFSNAITAPALRPAFNIMVWNDSVAVKQKIDLARKLGLKGVAIFKFDGGQDPKIWSVLAGQ